MKTQFAFSILRYTHDIVTQEFVNIGVVIFSPKDRYLKSICIEKYGRISRMFEKIDRSNLKKITSHIQDGINLLGEGFDQSTDLEMSDFVGLLSKILPIDDSAIRFAEPNYGMTISLEEELDSLFERYVNKYVEARDKTRKDDSKVWRVFRDAISNKDLLKQMKAHKVSTSEIEYNFKHAVKNGKWHVCEPISFDLTDDLAITKKATDWRGLAATLSEGTEEFKLNLLIGKPEDENLKEAYDKAKMILNKIGGASIFEEEEAPIFAKSIEDVIKHH